MLEAKEYTRCDSTYTKLKKGQKESMTFWMRTWVATSREEEEAPQSGETMQKASGVQHVLFCDLNCS